MRARRDVSRGLPLLWCCLLGCSGLSDDRAEKLIRRYNEQVVEAYRTADVSVVKAASAEERRKLTVLVDVNLDMSINLDAQLRSLAVEKVERAGGELLVTTRESWRYVERRTGTGEQVGPVGEDEYFIEYQLGERAGEWVVVQTRHAQAPRRNHPEAFGAGSIEVFHGADEAPSDAGGTP